jgi:DNA-binding transcriptional regulator YdaS (Cro superfamily)
MAIPPEDRKRIAATVGVNEQYLYQCLTGRRDMNPAEARRIERDTAGEIRRWDICQKSWHLIWPELIGVPGAPAQADRQSSAAGKSPVTDRRYATGEG